MHSFWLLLFVIKLYSHINIFNDKDSNIGYVFEVDVEYQKDFDNLHSDLPFL